MQAQSVLAPLGLTLRVGHLWVTLLSRDTRTQFVDRLCILFHGNQRGGIVALKMFTSSPCKALRSEFSSAMNAVQVVLISSITKNLFQAGSQQNIWDHVYL